MAAVLPAPVDTTEPALAPDGGASPRVEYYNAAFDSAPVRTPEPPPAPGAPAFASASRDFGEAGARSGDDQLPSAPGAALPTIAYPDPGGETSVFDGDFLILAAGAISMPSYEGSNDSAGIPAVAIAGKVKGIGINPRAAGLALDLVPDAPGAGIGFSLGPVARIRGNRTSHFKDPVVASLGKLDTVVEAGVAAGVTLPRVFNSHDRLSIGVDVRWDVSGRGSGYVVAPAVSYLTPLSRAMVAGILISAEFADGRNAHYNFDVSQAGAIASGLPAYSARGGFKSFNSGMFVAYDLNANLLDGGLAIGGGAMYGRLYGSAAETPITAIRGSRSQWVFGGGLGYVF